jgi:glucosamine kinase
MNDPLASNDCLYLGIDGGGSKCRAVIATPDHQVLGTGVAGPANPLQGMEQTVNSIIAATQSAMEATGLHCGFDQLIAGAGLAGVNLPGYYEQVCRWQHPFKRLHLTTDLHIACLGAHQGRDGAVLIVGTGSSAYVQVGSTHKIYGAHGFLLGDNGSGAWIGLEAVKAVLLATDNLGPPTNLSAIINQQLNTENTTLSEKMASASPAQFAQLAPLVFHAAENSDIVARRILQNAATYLNALADKLLTIYQPRLSLLGGIGERISPWLKSSVVERITTPQVSAEIGAIIYAQTMAGNNHTHDAERSSSPWV